MSNLDKIMSLRDDLNLVESIRDDMLKDPRMKYDNDSAIKALNSAIECMKKEINNLHMEDCIYDESL